MNACESSIHSHYSAPWKWPLVYCDSGVRDRFGQVGPDVARGIRMCH
jgi:hypothetical protein